MHSESRAAVKRTVLFLGSHMTIVCIYLTLHFSHLSGKASFRSVGQSGVQAAGDIFHPTFPVFDLKDDSSSTPSTSDSLQP